MELQNAERTLFARVRSGSSAEASSVQEEVPEGRTLPLTSSCVTMTYLRRVAQALAWHKDRVADDYRRKDWSRAPSSKCTDHHTREGTWRAIVLSG